jgi:hypothetical protein
MDPRYLMLEEEYDMDHWARYIEEAQVTRIVIFCTLILVHDVWKPIIFVCPCRFFRPSVSGPMTGPQ